MRLWITVGPFATVSIMDVALLIGSALLVLVLIARKQFDSGQPIVFSMLCVPLILSVISIVWSQDVELTVKWAFVNAESVIAYFLAVALFRGCAAKKIAWFMALFLVLCLLGSVLSALHVPGFEPQVPAEYEVGTANYLAYLATYYGRLSHPFIGLSNDFASVLVCYVLVFFSWGMLNKNLGYTILAFMTVLGITLTFSRGVMIPMAITAFLFLLRPEMRRFLPWLVGIVALMVLTVVMYYSLAPTIAVALADRTSNANVDYRLGQSDVRPR